MAGADQPQTYRKVCYGIVTDLIERGVEKSLERYPGNHESQDVRRRIISRFWGLAAQPADHDARQLVDTADCRARIIDRGGHGAERNIDDLDDSKLDILLHCPGRTQIYCGEEMNLPLRRYSVRSRYPDDRNAGRNEMADPALQAHPNAVLPGERNKAINIDISNVSRSPSEHGCARFPRGAVLIGAIVDGKD